MLNNIKQLRMLLGYSQSELALMTNVTRTTISNVETGKCEPTGKLMLRISKALKKPVDEIFFENTVQHVEQSY